MANDREHLDRRTLLLGAGAGVLGMVPAARATSSHPATAATAAAAASTDEPPESLFGRGCILTPAALDGPFYLNLQLLRRNITEGRPGVALQQYIRLVDATNCNPIPDAVIDLWHCDADGAYSGFASQGTAGQTFLRGIQITDQRGLVRFDSIFPGWYPGRTTHLHLKVILNNQTELSTQLYWPDNIPDPIYTTANSYVGRGARDTNNMADAFFNPDTEMAVQRHPNGAPIMQAGFEIAIS